MIEDDKHVKIINSIRSQVAVILHNENPSLGVTALASIIITIARHGQVSKETFIKYMDDAWELDIKEERSE